MIGPKSTLSKNKTAIFETFRERKIMKSKMGIISKCYGPYLGRIDTELFQND